MQWVNFNELNDMLYVWFSDQDKSDIHQITI